MASQISSGPPDAGSTVSADVCASESCINKGNVGAAVAADVLLPCPRMDKADRAGKAALIGGARPGSAGLSPTPVPAVGPAENHPEVHTSHVALAATAVSHTAVLGAADGALHMRSDDGDPA